MSDYIERVIVTVDSIDLDDIVNSVKESASTPTKAVNTMNKRRRARGFKQGNDTFQIDANCERIDPASGVPSWEQLRDSRTRFKMDFTPSVGPSYAYRTCVVTQVNDSASDGDSSQDVTIMALDKIYNPI